MLSEACAVQVWRPRWLCLGPLEANLKLALTVQVAAVADGSGRELPFTTSRGENSRGKTRGRGSQPRFCRAARYVHLRRFLGRLRLPLAAAYLRSREQHSCPSCQLRPVERLLKAPFQATLAPANMWSVGMKCAAAGGSVLAMHEPSWFLCRLFANPVPHDLISF